MAEPMVLGYVTSQYGRASDTFIRQEVRQLRKLGHEVVTFSIRRPAREHIVDEEVANEQAGTIYVLEKGPLRLAVALVAYAVSRPLAVARTLVLAWRTSAPGVAGMVWQMFYLLEAAYLARRVTALGVEHLHNHIGMNSASVCMLASELCGVPWSMTVHGPHDLMEPRRWSLGQKLEHSSFNVFVSEFGRGQGMLLAPPGISAKFHVVRCGIDERYMNAGAVRIPEEARFVFVGRLSAEKGVNVLIEAAARLARRACPVKLVLMGDGPERAHIEQAIDRHRLKAHVELIGWQGTDRVRTELIRARALVLPSFAEGLPVVLMEAFALQRPVVSTYVAGIPELVIPGLNGFLVPPGSVDQLADALQQVAEAPVERLEEMGRHGAELVRQRHDAGANARQLESLFWEAVRKRRFGSSESTEATQAKLR